MCVHVDLCRRCPRNLATLELSPHQVGLWKYNIATARGNTLFTHCHSISTWKKVIFSHTSTKYIIQLKVSQDKYFSQSSCPCSTDIFRGINCGKDCHSSHYINMGQKNRGIKILAMRAGVKKAKIFGHLVHVHTQLSCIVTSWLRHWCPCILTAPCAMPIVLRTSRTSLVSTRTLRMHCWDSTRRRYSNSS